MIEFQEEYENFIRDNGVGANDRVASSIKSYIPYINGVSRHLNITVGSNTLRTMNDIKALSSQLKGKISAKTITNYGSAMKQYISMVNELKL